jgi:mycothiol synthase
MGEKVMTIRGFREGDVEAVAGVRQATLPFDHDHLLARTVEAVRAEMERPGMDAGHNVFVAESDGGRAEGLAWVRLERGQEDIWGFSLTVHPDARAGQTGARLLQAVWERALQRKAESEGRMAWLQTEVNARAEWLAALLEQGGLRVARYELRMRCLLGQVDLPPLDAPEGIVLRPLCHPQDDHAVNAALSEAFRDGWGGVELSDDEFAHIFGSGHAQPDVSVVAWAGEEVAGACLNDFGTAHQAEAGVHEGWVSSLGVRRPWRKRGLATAILAWSLQQAAARKLKAVALDVDADNPTGAKRLYERVGFSEVERFLVYRKQMPGLESMGGQAA